MAYRYGTEEGGPIERPNPTQPDPRRRDEYMRMVEQDRRDEIERNRRLSDQKLGFQQQGYAGAADTIKAIPDAYAKGSEEARSRVKAQQDADAAEQTKQKTQLEIEQGQRTGQRDVVYGDRMAEADIGQREATRASTEEGAASMRSQTRRSDELHPGELAQQHANLQQTELTSQQTKSDLKKAGLELSDYQTQQNALKAAAVIQQAMQDKKAGKDIDIDEVKDRVSNKYGQEIAAKAFVLADSGTLQNEFVRKGLQNSDTDYKQYDELKNDAKTKASVVAQLNDTISQYEQNGGIIDNTVAEAALESAAQKLDTIGKPAAAAALRRGPFKQLLAAAGGDPLTKVQQLKDITKSLASELTADVVAKIDANKRNPYINMQDMNDLKNMIVYRPGTKKGSFVKQPVSPQNIPVSFTPEAAQMQMQQQQQPPPDLFSAPGAKPKAAPIPNKR